MSWKRLRFSVFFPSLDEEMWWNFLKNTEELMAVNKKHYFTIPHTSRLNGENGEKTSPRGKRKSKSFRDFPLRNFLQLVFIIDRMLQFYRGEKQKIKSYLNSTFHWLLKNIVWIEERINYFVFSFSHPKC